MSETKMPAVEADSVAGERELAGYELAFHVLPTVAEGEVEAVFQKLKDIITKKGGEITTEEAPARFDLAYEIIKHLEGRNRKFTSAYFGWVRFNIDPAAIEEIGHDLAGVKELLRHLLIKLTKVEEANPFFFHEALESLKSETIDVSDEEVKEVEAETGDATEDDSEESEKTEEEAESEDKA